MEFATSNTGVDIKVVRVQHGIYGGRIGLPAVEQVLAEVISQCGGAHFPS